MKENMIKHREIVFVIQIHEFIYVHICLLSGSVHIALKFKCV